MLFVRFGASNLAGEDSFVETPGTDRFSLIRESAGSNDRQRLVTLGWISREVIRNCSHPSASRLGWPQSADPAYERSSLMCVYFNDLHVEDQSTRVVFPIKGIDNNQYFVQLSSLRNGFDLFVGRAVHYADQTWTPDLHAPVSHGDWAKRSRLENCSADQAYFHGLSQVAAMINEGRFGEPQPITDPDPISIKFDEAGEAFVDIRAVTAQAGTDPQPDPSTALSNFDSGVFDSGWFTYAAGLIGAAAFMALAIGPGWLGFLLAAVPSSLLASWAITSHA